MYHNGLVTVIIPALNEERNIYRLVSSIFEQDYRPIEVIVIDGGSTDRTVSILVGLKNEISDAEFDIRILNEKDYGSLHSASNARNIGIRSCKGNYVIFLDADFVLIDESFVRKVKGGLDANPWVAVKVRPIIDSWIEEVMAMEAATRVHRYCAVRSELLRGRMFNPVLGMGEDRDFFEHLDTKMAVVDVFIGRHFPHTLSEYKKQKIWYGRTAWLYLRELPSFRNLFDLILRPMMRILTYPVSLLLAVMFLPFNLVYSLIFALIFVGFLLRSYIQSSDKSPSQFIYILFSVMVGTPFYVYGLLTGFIEYYLRHKIHSSRD